MEQTDIRNYFIETITFSLAKKDLFFIGQTLSTKYVNSDIAPFINNINRSYVDATGLDIDVVITLTIEQLFSIIDKLGKEPEFYYAQFNKEINDTLAQAINDLDDEDLRIFITDNLNIKRTSIDNHKINLINQYIKTQGL